MKNSVILNDQFSIYIAQATQCLRNNESEKAFDIIIKAMQMDPDAPQPHNLLGILHELKGDGNRARRHYRAAYSLDPTFKPACKNLEQICTVLDDKKPRVYDFGDRPEDSGAAFTDNSRGFRRA